jgi:hypothetical protein
MKLASMDSAQTLVSSVEKMHIAILITEELLVAAHEVITVMLKDHALKVNVPAMTIVHLIKRVTSTLASILAFWLDTAVLTLVVVVNHTKQRVTVPMVSVVILSKCVANQRVLRMTIVLMTEVASTSSANHLALSIRLVE